MGLWMERKGKGIRRFEVEDCIYGLHIEWMGLWMGREGKGIRRFEVEHCIYRLHIEYTVFYVMNVIYHIL